MKRKTMKWIFGLSLAGLIFLMVFTVALWAMANAAGVLLRLLFILDEDMKVSGMPFSVFMSKFVGSPLFHAYVVDATALLMSIVALIITRKQ
jgi:hypothetical protein